MPSRWSLINWCLVLGFIQACTLPPVNPLYVCYQRPTLTSSLETEECIYYATLAEVITESDEESTVSVEMMIEEGCQWGLEKFTVGKKVTLWGNSADLILTETVEISESGSLSIHDSFLSSLSPAHFEVFGAMHLSNCTLFNWTSPILHSTLGIVSIEDSTIEGCHGSDLILVVQSLLTIVRSVFRKNDATVVSQEAGKSLIGEIRVQNCELVDNSGKELVHIHGEAGTVAISSCEFSRNSGLLFALQISHGNMTIENCTFSRNTAGGVWLFNSTGSLLLVGSVWTDNDFPLLWVNSTFEGSLRVEGVTILNQRLAAAMHIANQGRMSDCNVAISNTDIKNITVHPSFETAGVLYSQSCTVSISNTSLFNCTTMSTVLSEAYSVLFSTLGFLSIRNVTITSSGGTGTVIGFLLSSGVIDDVTITRAAVGSEGMIIILGSRVSIPAIRFISGGVFSVLLIRYGRLFLIFGEMSDVVIGNLTVLGSWKGLSGTISGYSANITCDYLVVRSITSYSVVSEILTNLVVKHSVCEGCLLYCFEQGNGPSSVSFLQGYVINSTFRVGMFYNGFGGDVRIENFWVSDVRGNYVISGNLCLFRISDSAIIDSQIGLVLSDILRSTVVLSRTVVRNLNGGILSASSTTVEIEDCVIENAHTEGDFARIDMGVLSITSTKMREIESRGFIAVSKSSELRVSLGEFRELRTAKMNAFDSIDSKINVKTSNFSSISGRLINGLRSTVSLTELIVRDGGFGYNNGSISLYLFGGVLKCIDCVSANLSSVRVVNVSADLGGCLYMGSIESPSALNIDNSEFDGCWANSGGVAYLRNVSFSISDSSFVSCSAEVSGGALDLNVRTFHSRMIEGCSFVNNSAHDGGAIRWRSSEPNFTNLIFANNTAVYGADVASYGNSIQIADDYRNIAPGQATNVTFLLVDHYGQKVAMTSSKMIILSQTASLTFGGINYKINEEGVFNFLQIEFYAAPNSTQTLTAIYQDTTPDYSISLQFSYSISLRDCEVGEIKQANACYTCPAGHYSFNTSDFQCSICPAIALCPGGALIIPKKDAWLTSNYHDPVLSCPIRDTCSNSKQEICEEGYDGLLCSHCAPGYFSLVFSTCRKCPPQGVVWAEVVVMLGFNGWFLYTLVGFQTRKVNDAKLDGLKTLISHVQILGLLAYVRIRFPVEIEVLLHLILSFSTLTTANFPFACFGQSYYFNIGAASLLSIATPLLISIYFLIKTICRKVSIPLTHELPSVLRSLCYFLPFQAGVAVLPLFVCQSVGGAEEWLVIDISEKCWVGHHLTLVYCLAVPSLLITVLVPSLVYLYSTVCWPSYSTCVHHCFDLVLFLLKVSTLCAVLLQTAAASQLFLALLCQSLSSAANSLSVLHKRGISLVLVQLSEFTLVGSCALMFYFLEYESRAGGVVICALFFLLNFAFTAIAAYVIAKEYRSTRSNLYASSRGGNQSDINLVPPNNSITSIHSIELEIEEEKEGEGS